MSEHPMDLFAAMAEAEADDPSCWEPEMFVEGKYGDLFTCEVGDTLYDDKDGIDGTFYYVNPNNLYITVEIADVEPDSKDRLSLLFYVDTQFVFHSDDELRTAKAEIGVELVDGNSKSLHEFDWLEYKEWANWPEPEVLKTWIAGEINRFLAGFGRITPVRLDDIR